MSLAFLKKFFDHESERTAKARKNIVASLFLKGIHVGIYFLVVPITLTYLKPLEYGIWLTLSSILLWISFFDIGLGQGLRNRLVEALAKNDLILAKEYVSTCFALVSMLMIVFCTVALSIIPFLNWAKLLNTPLHLSMTLMWIMIVVFSMSGIQFILKLLNSILLADQKPAISDFITVLGNFFAFIGIYILSVSTQGNLLYVSLVFMGCPLLISFISLFICFKGPYNFLKPSLSYVKFKHTKNLIGIGSQFFIIQIAVLVMWNASNFVVIQMLGPSSVTTFSIAFRYFGAVTMIFNIILSPFWSAYTEAYHKNEIDWIKKNVLKLIQLFVFALLAVIMMILVASPVYKFWIGDLFIPSTINIYMGLYVILLNWHNIFIFFINGVSKIRLQLFTNVVQAIFCIPINIVCIKLFGIEGAAIALVIITLPNAILSPLQFYKIVYKNSNGIWNR